MSTPITYDSLLVHYLARELEGRLSARRLRRVRFDSEHRRFTLELRHERLVWELHPTRGWIRVIKDEDDDETADLPTEAAEGFGGRRIRTQRRPRVRRITAPLDDRVLEIEIDAGGADRASRFVVELMTNQWNVLALAPDGRILSALWTRDAGGRALEAGEVYRPPGGFEPREGIDEPITRDRWLEILADVDPDDRPRTLVRSVAWTSPLNAGPILDGGGSSGAPEPEDAAEALEAAWLRYRELASRPEPHPQLLEHDGGVPYPLPLPGITGRPVMSLLAAFDEAATADPLAPEVRAALEDRLERVSRKAERLREEAEKAPERARRLRSRADLLMARLHEVEKGTESVDLPDFEGGTVTFELDPALSPVQNAERMYDQAGRRERAAEQLPARVREAVAERHRLEGLLDALDDDDVDPDELARWIEELRPESGDAGGDSDRRPYRRFRSSGGFEIRVGRSGKANDELTFHHSAPDDIWLHARDVAGAHVILRWPDREQNPPKRDLLEAAILAAVHSKARTSGTVPVDWTRRKYVRSPRKAPPGTVIPDRVSTVFVEPDEEVVARLAE
ncbi:MAG: NFACT family protein [Longimicrobiales bacterium]